MKNIQNYFQIDKGYVFNGRTCYSIKQGYQCRRIKLNADGTVFTIAAGMPYMTALTEDVEKTLFLRQCAILGFNLCFRT